MKSAQIEKTISEYLKTGSLEFLGAGDFCSAYLADNEWVFRFAKHDEARRSLQREFCLLPKIAGQITLRIPFPELASFDSEPSFIAYRLLPDNSLEPELYLRLDETERTKCAVQVAEFLNQFHSLEIETAQNCGVKTCDYRSKYRKVLSEARSRLFPLLPRPEQNFIEQVIAEYLTAADYQPALLHGDLSPDHVLFNATTGSVSGIIDFGDMMIGDPLWDLLWIYEDYGLEFLARFLPAFHPANKTNVLERLFRYSMLEFFDWTLRSQQEDRTEFESCLIELKKMYRERALRFGELRSVCRI
jgi:aminoglycoside 2''-phosphotransferase